MADSPEWFWQAVDIKPESEEVDVDDCTINYRVWGDRNKPGLLLVHGHGAHSHWWDFIAPSFSDDYCVVALDLSGMGDSDHRDNYSADLYAQELRAVSSAMNFGSDLIVVAHSFGGIMALHAAFEYPEMLKGLVLLDSGVKSPDDERPPEPERWNKPKVYPTFEIARSRFRLQPPQSCANEYIVSYIAHHSVEGVDEGFTWKFDEEHSSRMSGSIDLAEEYSGLTCKLALIYGQNSEYFSSDSAQHMLDLQPSLQVTELADSQHHLFLDQPEAFITALRSTVADW